LVTYQHAGRVRVAARFPRTAGDTRGDGTVPPGKTVSPGRTAGDNLVFRPGAGPVRAQ